MKPLTVLSLFNGMSCGYLALNDAGIPVQTYYSSEIDKHAIKASRYNFPNIIHLGDINRWKEWNIDWKSIDLLLGGSPCTDISFAGKQAGLKKPDSSGENGTRSGLFYIMMDIFEHIKSLNPNVDFIFENVKMKQESFDVFNQHIGKIPHLINSQNFTAHYRQRYYWISTDVLITIPPLSKSEKLKDILETGWYTDRDKSYCIDANYYKGGDCNQYFNKSRRQLVFSDSNIDKDYLLSTNSSSNNILYRKLTVQECCKLQGVPTNFFEKTSNTQAYKMLGNGWTVPVIAHLLKAIYESY